LSRETLDIINATAGIVSDNALLITSAFYVNMFKRNPETTAFFNKSHQRNREQPKALSHAIKAFAGNIENVAAIEPHLMPTVHKHCALSVKPEHYPIVHDNMMFTIGQVLGSAVTPQIAKAWSEAIMHLSGILINHEENLYKTLEQRKGGWRYERKFRMAKRTQLADDVMGFTFKADDGYKGGFDWEAGQYLTLRLVGVDHITPRHYMVTNKPGSAEFQVATRMYEGGYMSNYMHTRMIENEPCLLAAPCGIYTQKAMPGDKNVLISAGIGIGANKAHLDTLGKSKVVKALHVEKNAGRHAFAGHFQDSGVDCEFHYTDSAGLPDFEKMAKKLVSQAGTDAVYRICAPAEFISNMKSELNKAGCKKVQYEKFGSGQVASK
jgi:nitric oxide dioxygenase